MNIATITPRLKGLVKIGKNFIAANRPEILFGTSVVSTVAAVGLSAKAGYEARGLVDEAEQQRDFSEPPMTTKEKIQVGWRPFVPAGAALVTSLGSTTGLHLVHVKEKKQLAAVAMSAIQEVKDQANAYAEDIRDSVVETLNPTDEEKREVEERLMEKNADRHGGVAWVSNSDGEVEEMYLVRDGKTGRDIWSNEFRINQAINEVNAVITRQGDCELNLFYSLAGFGLLPDGDDWGWSGNLVDLHWDLTVRDDGRPARRFTFRTDPEKGYNSAHG